MEHNKIIVFESKTIRRIWHKEEWYFSVVDVCGALTDAPNDLTARKYWNKLAQRLRAEGSEVVTNCHRLKLEAPDGKMRGGHGVESLFFTDDTNEIFLGVEQTVAVIWGT